MARIYRLMLQWLQRKCRHNVQVVANILEGRIVDDVEVRWCRMCGAYRFRGSDYWRKPDAEK